MDFQRRFMYKEAACGRFLQNIFLFVRSFFLSFDRHILFMFFVTINIVFLQNE